MDKPLVLVVEDDAILLLDVESTLQDAGFDVITAYDGGTALVTFADHRDTIRAVVTDVDLGQGLSGWEVARHIRANVPTMTVVYMTADNAHEWAAQGVPESQLLLKPFANAQLITAVSGSLNEVPLPAA